MRLIVVGLLASLTIAAPASAQTAKPSATEVRDDKGEKAKRVCRSIQATGQRIPKRECKTESEWATIDAGRDSADALRIKSFGHGGS